MINWYKSLAYNRDVYQLQVGKMWSLNCVQLMGTFWCKYPPLDTVWCDTDMISAEFVYQTDPAFITFMGPKSPIFL